MVDKGKEKPNPLTAKYLEIIPLVNSNSVAKVGPEQVKNALDNQASQPDENGNPAPLQPDGKPDKGK